jgi:hypothetical protein
MTHELLPPTIPARFNTIIADNVKAELTLS